MLLVARMVDRFEAVKICAGELSTRDKDRFERTGEVTRSVKPATEHILHEHDVFVLMQIVFGKTQYLST